MIQVANAPCSWGVLEFDLQGEVAGCAQILDEIRDTGYAGTELGDWGFMPTDPAALAAALNKRDLILVGGFVPVPWSDFTALGSARTTALRTATLMRDAGFPEAVVVLADDNGKDRRRTARAGQITEADGWSPGQWKAVAGEVTSLAREIFEETGIRCVFHPHAAGFVETPGEVDRLLEEADPDLVNLVLDTGHCCYGGGDPLEMLRRWRARISLVHFKDWHPDIAREANEGEWDYFQAVARGVFCLLGEGAVPFQSIVEELHEQAYQGWVVVEQDVLPGMGDPKGCALANREFLRGLGL